MFSYFEQVKNAKYKKDGRTHQEVDCYGLCYLFNKEVLNKEIPIYASYQKDQDKYFKIPIGKEISGDIISLNIKGYPIHVGVIIQKGIMLHIMENSKPVIETYLNQKWIKRVDSIWRYESIK